MLLRRLPSSVSPSLWVVLQPLVPWTHRGQLFVGLAQGLWPAMGVGGEIRRQLALCWVWEPFLRVRVHVRARGSSLGSMVVRVSQTLPVPSLPWLLAAGLLSERVTLAAVCSVGLCSAVHMALPQNPTGVI